MLSDEITKGNSEDLYHNPLIESTRETKHAEEFDYGYITNRNKLKLFYRAWKLKDLEIPENPKIVLHIHGMVSHSEPYIGMADWIVGDNLLVYGLDLQGHGHSEGFRGDYENFLLFLENIEDMLIELNKKYSHAKFILSGESMGGLAITLYLATKALHNPIVPIEKAVMWAPAYKTVSSSLDLQTFFSNIPLPFYLIFNSGKPVVKSLHKNTFRKESCAEFDRTDPILLPKTSARYLFNIYKSMKKLRRLKASKIIETPFCIIHGTGDLIVDQKATKKFYNNCTIHEKCRYIEVPDAWHCIYGDPSFNNEFAQQIRDFLN